MHMWKVTFDNPYGADPSICLVNAESATEAETIARQQIRGTVKAAAPAVVQHTDDIDPADEQWPRPRMIHGLRVHTFTDSRTAYDHTQHRNNIHDGDILHIPSENIAGFLMQAWPVAVSPNKGELHGLTDPTNLVIDGVDYSPSAHMAATLISSASTDRQPVQVDTITRGLVPADGVWTVTIAGSERHDGHGPYIWVVNAPDAHTAATKAEQHHRTTEDDTDTVIRRVEPGAPGADYGWAYNDLRGIAAKTIVLTPRQIRQLARIRLAYKRRDDHYIQVAKVLKPGEAFPPHEADALDDMTAGIADLVAEFMEDLGYPL